VLSTNKSQQYLIHREQTFFVITTIILT